MSLRKGPEQLTLQVEPPLIWHVYAPDGQLITMLEIPDGPNAWHEASLWAYLASKRYEEHVAAAGGLQEEEPRGPRP